MALKEADDVLGFVKPTHLFVRFDSEAGNLRSAATFDQLSPIGRVSGDISFFHFDVDVLHRGARVCAKRA